MTDGPLASSSRPLDRFLACLSGVVTNGPNSWKSLCPIHEADGGSHNPSMVITEKDDGTVLIYCHVCKLPDFGPKACGAVGFPIRELFPDYGRTASDGRRDKKRPKGKKTGEWEYRDADGVVQYKTMRFDQSNGTKEFSCCRPNGRGGWLNNMRGVARVPYRLPELIAASKDQYVFVVEGEKKVEALRDWGLIATCNAGGAGKWKKDWATYFRDRKVIVLPDNDPVHPETGKRPGQDHARDVFESLKEHAALVRVLELPDLPLKGDIVDWKAAGHTLPEFLELVERVAAGDGGGPDGAGGVATSAVASAIAAAADPLSIQYLNSRTDVANGLRLIEKYGKQIRFCQPMGKWFIWTGRRWCVDQKHQIDRFAIDCTRDMWTETAVTKAAGSMPLTVGEMEKHCKYSDSIQGMTRAVRAAQTDASVQVLPHELDSDPWLFNVANGTIDLRSGDLLPHDPTHLNTKMSPVTFDPDATCPTWERFVKQVFRGDVEVIRYIKRLCGYWATGLIREQMLPIFWGGGSNGKTTFLNVILEVLGMDYAMKAPQDFLMQKRGEQHPTEKADLHGKRFVACSETEEGRKLSEGLVKELTGKERIRARRMKEDFWEFDPTHKIILITNHKPVISGGDHGLWRRLRLIEFGQTFWDPSKSENGPPDLRQDKLLDDKLRMEYPGIFRWIMEGCQNWQHEEECVPMSVEIQTAEYKDSQDVVSQWMDERCDRNDDATERASDLYLDYRGWALKMGEYLMSQRKFSMTLADKGLKKKKVSVVYFCGLSLLNLPDSTASSIG